MSGSPAQPQYSAEFLVEDRQRPAAIGMVVCTSISAIVVLIRLYARGIMIKELGWDDGIITLAMLCSWVTMGLSLMCIPLSALWGATNGKCIQNKVVFLVTSIMTIICDSLILVLPVNIILAIKATLARKIALGFVLCFGVFAIVTSICRLISMIVALDHPDDVTWYFSPVIAWSLAEVATAIIALSLPALHGLFGKILMSTRSQGGTGSTGTGTGTGNSLGGGESYNLKSTTSSSRRRIFDGADSYHTQTNINAGRNTSEEALWSDQKGENIRVVDTVRVDVERADTRLDEPVFYER